MAPPGNWKFYDPNTAPRTFDIVLCKFPFSDNPNFPPNRCSPCLVRRVRVNKEKTAAYVSAVFGTTNLKTLDRMHLDLIVQNNEAMHKLGLWQATRFDLGATNTAELPWSKEWFPIPKQRMTPMIGCLDDHHVEVLLGLLQYRKARGITN